MEKRILAIDVLRGLTIAFMIIVNTPGSWSHVFPPLLHAEWHGCTPTDLVFPFFLFIVGVSMAFSFLKYEDSQRSIWAKKVIKRGLLIFLVGLALNWFPFYHKSFSDLRLFGVLQRIGISFAGAGLLIIGIRNQKYLKGTTLAILIAYWLLLLIFGQGDPYSLEGNLSNRIDLFLFGEQHLYKGFGRAFDPEGLFSSLPGIAHVLIGYFIGKLIYDQRKDKYEILKRLLAFGLILIGTGQLWDLILPINKPLWTSSYVLYTCGLACMVLLTLIAILDIKKWTKWAYPFRVFGLNPLISYVLSVLFIKINIYFITIGDSNLYNYLYASFYKSIGSPELGSFLQALSFSTFIWFFAWLLYRKNRIIKL